MNQYLVDSDYLINSLKGKSLIPVNKFSLSVISVAEIEEGLLGIKRTKRLSAFRKTIEKIKIIQVTIDIAQNFSRIRKNLRKRGLLIDNMDLLIAATALEHNLILITNNTKHFSKIPELKIYKP